MLVRAERLAKRFGTFAALTDVSFEAREGEILGVLGPNGAGKTTTMRILSTLLRPTAGRAEVAGADVATSPQDARRALGVLPEAAGLYGRLTAREALRYAGRLHGLAGEDLERRIEGLSALLDLGAFIDRRCEPFSRGMKQRVALARALLRNPIVLLLDEPTAGLDVVAARTVRRALAGLRDAGKCILLSTHLMAEVERLCDRVVILGDGRVRGIGTLAELRGEGGELEEIFVRLAGAGSVV
ncbi:MAG: ABC transporter ATP-binding protein [Armatimonadetes bacterium]|nr:ABC transporter ATP-binding protein [Armatimonadota bacterium]